MATKDQLRLDTPAAVEAAGGGARQAHREGEVDDGRRVRAPARGRAVVLVGEAHLHVRLELAGDGKVDAGLVVALRLDEVGYRRAADAQPNLLIHYHANINQRFEVHGMEPANYPNCYPNCEPAVVDDLVAARRRPASGPQGAPGQALA